MHDRFGQLGLMRQVFPLEKMCGSSPTDAASYSARVDKGIGVRADRLRCNCRVVPGGQL